MWHRPPGLCGSRHTKTASYGRGTDRSRDRKGAIEEETMEVALQGAIWLGAGVTLVMLLSRRRRRNEVR